MIRPQEGETGRAEGEGRREKGAGERTSPWKREVGWRARQESRQRDEAVEKRETVRPRKDRAAAPAYQLFQESSARISINSNDKCGPLWQRLINSARRGGRGGDSPEQEFKSFNATGLNKCSEGAC